MLAAKFIAAALVFAGYLLLPGCVTVGYDFLKQQATVTVTPSTKGLRKVSNVAVDQEAIWKVVRRYPSAGLAEFALRMPQRASP
jgi:hypothetical protein